MPRARPLDRRGAEYQAAARRGQVHADLFGTLRVVAFLGGVATAVCGALAMVVGYATLWVVVPVVVERRLAVGAGGAMLALGGLGFAWSGLALCARARDVATLRARLARAAQMGVLCGAPGALCAAWLVHAGAGGAEIRPLAWVGTQVLVAPVGLAAVFGCARAATPRDRSPENPERTRPGFVSWVIASAFVLLAVMPAILPTSLSYWPHRALPAEPDRAVAALDARAGWERSWRFRTAHAFPWNALLVLPVPVDGLPALDPATMTPVRAQEAIAEIAREAREDDGRRALLLGLITSPTAPVRVRTSAVEQAAVLQPLPDDVAAALIDLLRKPTVDLRADMTNWWGRVPSNQEPLIAAEDRLRLRAMETLLRTRTCSPAALEALRALADHPRLDVVVRPTLATLEREALANQSEPDAPR